MSKPSKTRKMTAGDQLITRAELQFFAKAVDARLAQAIGKLREELTAPDFTGTDDPAKAACDEAFVGYTECPTSYEGGSDDA